MEPEADRVASGGGDVPDRSVEDRLELRGGVRVLIGPCKGQELDVAQVDPQHEEGLAVPGGDEVAGGFREGVCGGGGRRDRDLGLLHLGDIGRGTVPSG